MPQKLIFQKVIILVTFLTLVACDSGIGITFPEEDTSTENNSNDTGNGDNNPPVEPSPTDPDPVNPTPTPTNPVDTPITVSVPGNPPRNVTASVNTLTKKISVGWKAVTGATYYELWRSTVPARKGTRLGVPTATNFVDTTTAPGIDYWYGLKACNNAGCSGFSGQAQVLVLDPTNNNSTNNIPKASNDSVTTEMNLSANINVLANDTGLNDGPIQTKVFSASTNGTTIVEADNTITYTPKAGYNGSDSFSYYIWDKDNDIATATVSIEITCTTCITPTTISLSWIPNIDQVDGYRVFYGKTATTTASLVTDTTSTTANFDAKVDLSLKPGDTACFALKAYNTAGVSNLSTAVCTII